MSHTRRNLIKSGAALTALSAMPRPLLATLRQRPEPVPPIEDPDIKRLTDASLNAARAAGATYAEARLTHTYYKQFSAAYFYRPWVDEEFMTIGVRVLVDGYWGFASSPVWTTDEAVRLTEAAIRNGKANMLGVPRTLDLAPVTPIANGHWETPIKEDPFAMSHFEIADYLVALYPFTRRINDANGIPADAEFVKQEKVFASTADQYYTQRLYRTTGNVGVTLRHPNGRLDGRLLDTLSPASVGFEYFRDQPLREQLRALRDELWEDLSLPVKPVDVGRHNVVFDANSVSNLVSETIGVATELDRALGYEANASGTSYITEPLEMVGSLKIGAPSVTITANRSQPQGAATVKWDDEGIVPQEFTLVKDGILTDMQTNRECAALLKDYYAKRQQPVTSNGCAYTPDAIKSPITHCANLRMAPSTTNATFDTLIAGQEKGIAVKGAVTLMDFQQVTGYSVGRMYEIKNGKRVAEFTKPAILFRTPELWSALIELGGTESQRQFGLKSQKGTPWQTSYHTVSAVPIVAKELAVIDKTRKA